MYNCILCEFIIIAYFMAVLESAPLGMDKERSAMSGNKSSSESSSGEYRVQIWKYLFL